MVVWLFLVVWVATGLDIDCNNPTASPLSLNVTTAPSVRILNCTQRIAVNVPCGIDKDHLMRVEVVGGTTVPVFDLVSCTVNGALSFSFATLTVRNVLMSIDPAKALNLQNNSLFSTQSVFTLSINVLNSRLQWTSGYLIYCDGYSSIILGLNISVTNSFLASGSTEVPMGGAVFLSAANIQSISIAFMNSSISVVQTSDSARGIIRVSADNGFGISIEMVDSVVSAWSEGFGNFYCVIFTWYSSIGFLSHTLILVSGSTFVALVETSFVVSAMLPLCVASSLLRSALEISPQIPNQLPVHSFSMAYHNRWNM